jgi:cell division protein YceG involved in septum cleavage
MKTLTVLSAILLTLIAGLAGVAYMFHARAYEPFRAYPDPERVVNIPRGTATPAIGRLLVEAGVVRDTTTFRMAVWLSGDARRLQAGEYRFDRPLSAVDVLG